MSLLTDIKAASLQARKDKNSVVTSLLTTLIGEANAIGKNNGNRETTDAEVITIIKKFVSNATETKSLIHNAAFNAHESLNNLDHQQLDALTKEIDILNSFLPTQLTHEQLDRTICDLVVLTGATSIKDMGKIMKALKEQHEGTYDGAKASALIKEKLVQ